MLAIYYLPRLTSFANLRRRVVPTILLSFLDPSSLARTATPFLSALLPPRFPVMDGTTPSPTPGPASKISNSPPAPTAGTKRKRGSAGKYYAVKVGYQPGVYYEWKECLAQVTGFKGAVPRLPEPRRSECVPDRCENTIPAGRVAPRIGGDAILRDPARTQAGRLYQLGQCARTN
ncbi:hypothetical protein BJX63DRAFT_53687 [Aspergillus granulosus]|uniref:Ribonuclease H1 N-terminal domain-containing protein n=1 Tax=Aspergillus granulosus TaxID=176169 RepID=A0ABR4GXW3_9EURO